ncbi:DUF2917 domain-containing protein [Sphaerotilaceae bacterium SBD11-9]
MRLASASQSAFLLRRQTFNLQARKGQRIECQTGQLWITQDGDPNDVILAPAQSFTLDRSGHALVSALEDASFVLRGPGAAAAVAAY